MDILRVRKAAILSVTEENGEREIKLKAFCRATPSIVVYTVRRPSSEISRVDGDYIMFASQEVWNQLDKEEL